MHLALVVDHHPDPLLRLEVRKARAAGLRPTHRGGQFVDADVELAITPHTTSKGPWSLANCLPPVRADQ